MFLYFILIHLFRNLTFLKENENQKLIQSKPKILDKIELDLILKPN